ncbi:hypothetical protein CFE70_005955 [Pyrenophora teres f. teres 0-1]|nr:hypothetical protein HRS9122_04191 [Pyrenophora teres f. teres]KAE8871971.1 hypothetical protein PTNB73_03430 [Pyrenophora teres f. teres]
MAKGPAVVVIARHGARLDAADKSWHLTSPTPYDPPLTYGGWSQAKALGQRIAALLHDRDLQHQKAEGAKSATDTDPAHLDLTKLTIGKDASDGLHQPKKKKRKIIIHSSPFLRCVQTSTAVAAGISQYQNPTTPQLGIPTPSKANGEPKAPRAKPSSSQPRTFERLADPNLDILPRPNTGPERILLRIDAFLGEWLSPEYYADITAPPNSTMMVAGAKADLLRRGDYIQEQPNANSSKGHFPGGWVGNKAAVNNTGTANKTASSARGSLAQIAAFRERSSSYTGPLDLERTRSKETVAPLATPIATPVPTTVSKRVYEPPNPSYSVSPADPIPRGYVAHAQDACVKVDFQWDSMRPPQNWGDGGEYGDEWSTMHKRFRRGLAGMMDWYRTYGTAPPKESFPGFMFKEPLRLTPPISHAKSDPFPAFGDDPAVEEEEEELVLILVTHGAGCNALLGAITNQPVLMDIGLASLSMAVRRDVPRKTSTPATVLERRRSVADPGMSDTYDVKLSASIDHLRPGVDPSKPLSAKTPSSASPAVTSSPSLEYRRRFTGSSSTTNSTLDVPPFSIGDAHRTWNSSMSSARRTMSSGSTSRYMHGHGASTTGTASPAGGLWSGTSTPVSEAEGHSFGGAAVAKQNSASSTSATATASASTQHSEQNSAADANYGLMRLDSKEEREVGDKFTPLVSASAAQARKQSTVNTAATAAAAAAAASSSASASSGSAAASGGGGLWGAKATPKAGNGLWGPPKLDDVYEHRHGPKRRWTVTEREE